MKLTISHNGPIRKISRAFRLIAATIAFMAMAQSAFADTPRIKVTLDSAYITMGRQTGVNVTVVDHAATPGQLIFSPDSLPKEVELVSDRAPQISSRQLPEGGNEIKAQYLIQSFDSGAYTIPPIAYVNGSDTVFGNELTLKVVPVDVKEDDPMIGEAPTEEIKSKWFDWIPDFITDNWVLILLGILIIIGAICAYLIFSKRIKIEVKPKRKVIPPYDLAISQLNQLRSEQLWEKGQEKAFYTELTDILREYIDNRFGINAMEMTSAQIIKALKSNEQTKMSKDLMQQILEIADYVKFAKVTPLRDDNIRSFDAAYKFVEDTKPVEQSTEQSADEADNGNSVKS